MGVVANGSIAAALYTSLPPGDHVRTLAVAEPKALVVEDPKIDARCCGRQACPRTGFSGFCLRARPKALRRWPA